MLAKLWDKSLKKSLIEKQHYARRSRTLCVRVHVRMVLIEFMFKFTGMCLLILNHEERDFFPPPEAQTLVRSEQIGMIQRNISCSDRGLSCFFVFFFYFSRK